MSDFAMIDAEEIEEEILVREGLAQTVKEDMSAFVSPPGVYLKVKSMLDADHSSADDFAEVISSDPNMTLRLLKLVNSAYYSLPSEIDTVSRAITMVGMRDLMNLICAVSAVQSFSRISNDVTNMKAFWRHSIYCGAACKLLAKRMGDPDTDKMFTVGLLHDIGTLVINKRFPEIAEKSIIQAAGNEAVLAESERHWLGFDHAALGGLILTDWGLSESLCDAIRYHHKPDMAKVAPQLAAVIQIADCLATQDATSVALDAETDLDETSREVLAESGITEAIWRDELAPAIETEVAEIEALFSS